MTRGAKALGLGAMGAAVVGGALMYQSQSGGVDAATYTISLTGAPRTIDEGELVEFLAAVTEPDGSTARGVTLRWDFGDDTTATGADRERQHRFANGAEGASTYVVTVSAGSSERSLPIKVRNVAPTLGETWHSRPALAGDPVEFEATATDPGRDDRLTYTWDFGDGGTAEGQRVGHVFEDNGRYNVTVTVGDGDGGEDRQTVPVLVGDGFELTTGGDATGRQEGWIWVRSRILESGPGIGLCEVQIRFEARGEGLARMAAIPTFGLSIATTGGLRTGTYMVTGQHWSGMAMPASEFLVQNANVFSAGMAARLADPPVAAAPLFQAGQFTATGGMVEIDYLDQHRIEGSFRIEPMWAIVRIGQLGDEDFGERQASVSGHFAGRFAPPGSYSILVTQPWEVYQCQPESTETFDIASVTPEPGARNVPFEEPQIEITFTRPVDRATLFGNLLADYRMTDGNGEAQAWPEENWTLVDSRTVRLEPQGRLESGTVYCVRVRAGRDGVRGEDGEVLEPAPAEYGSDFAEACDSTRPWAESREWAIATQVELESARVDLYQASQAGGSTMLAPGKATVSRVYTSWRADPRIHPAAQVTHFPARVSVLANGAAVYAPKRVDIHRPDQFDDWDVRHALHTLNFFNWRPAESGGSVDVQAVIEPIDGSGAPVGRRESEVTTARLWDRREVLSFDYYFLTVDGDCHQDSIGGCTWSESISDHWRSRGHTLAAEGALFTTQNFPVLETQARAMGDLTVDEPSAKSPCVTRPAWQGFRCYHAGTSNERRASEYMGAALYELAQYSSADIIVGLVPPGFDPVYRGIHLGNADDVFTRVVLLHSNVEAATVAHEFGHFYDLDHCPEDPLDMAMESAMDGECAPILGFRMSASGRSGMNKHRDEGNQELDSPYLEPLMHYSGSPSPARFITTDQYDRLFGNIAAMPRRPSAQGRRGPSNPLRRLADILFPVPVSAEVTTVPGRRRAASRSSRAPLVRAHDGFDRASADVDLGLGSALAVLATVPQDAATGVDPAGDVMAWISSPMLVSSSARVVPLETGSFRLVAPDGSEVFADVAYQRGTGLITLTPNTPLRPDTRYTATIEGLEDRWGNRLAAPVTWSFRTGGRASSSTAAGRERR